MHQRPATIEALLVALMFLIVELLAVYENRQFKARMEGVTYGQVQVLPH